MLSRGVPPIQMPYVVNMTEEEARAQLANLGIEVDVSSDYNDDVPEGHVFSQSITDGKFLERGTTVVLGVSL